MEDKVNSLLYPLACGFRVVAAWECRHAGATDKERYEEFNGTFACMDFKKFQKQFVGLKKEFQKASKHKDQQHKSFEAVFSKKAWLELSQEEQEKHTAYNCGRCSGPFWMHYLALRNKDGMHFKGLNLRK